MQKAFSAILGAAFAAAVASTSATAAPVVLNSNFATTDTAANTTYSTGNFFIQNWTPTGYASNSFDDPGQFNNGSAGGRPVVGFLSGASTSLSQVVNGFVAGLTYQISVAVDARAGMPAPTFRILADGNQVYGPATLPAADPINTFATAFTIIQSNTFIATDTFVQITFANASTSNVNGSTLLSAASVSQVPEPVSLALLGAGLVGIGVARRRRG